MLLNKVILGKTLKYKYKSGYKNIISFHDKFVSFIKKYIILVILYCNILMFEIINKVKTN